MLIFCNAVALAGPAVYSAVGAQARNRKMARNRFGISGRSAGERRGQD
jgi:hypothetical protein